MSVDNRELSGKAKWRSVPVADLHELIRRVWEARVRLMLEALEEELGK